MSTYEPKVSIIIPIYNTQKYLKECLDSIVNQTYTNIEVILVDDGSPDNSSLIYEQYLEKYSYFRCIKQANQGLSAARNSGVSQSSGEYIAFVDSDDIVSKFFIEILVDGVITKGCNIACCGLCNFYSDDSEAVINKLDSCDVNSRKYKLYDSSVFFKQVMYQKLPLIAAWCKLCKREYIENTQFVSGILWEDRINILDLVMKVDKIAVCDYELYGYRCQQSSLTNSRFSKKHYDCIKVADIMEHKAEKYGEDMIKAVRCNIFNMFYTCFFYNAYTDREARYTIWKYVRKYSKYVRKDKSAKFFERCLAYLVIFGKYVFYFGMRTITWLYRRLRFVA